MAILDAADVTWTAASDIRWAAVVVYADKRVRDWRWLWLRKKWVTEIVDYDFSTAVEV